MGQSQPIKIAILAMGGEGGGVLADWIVAMGEAHGWIAQSTSVPGVAQRTGATIYYVELFPAAQADGLQPVLALMPLPGDVDVVLASELMEAGRAVQRGLVTPDRTTLIASTHRVYSIAEKSALGDGRVDSGELLAHCAGAARRFVRFDMAQVAEVSGSVISAVLFGALAGSGVLPFERAMFERTIEHGGAGAKASLAAFASAWDRVRSGGAEVSEAAASEGEPSPIERPRDAAIDALLDRLHRDVPAGARPIVLAGLRRLVDYQDPAYAGLYLDRLAALPSNDVSLLNETARHLALWMSFEDTIRIADLKTRDSRFARVRDEVRPDAAQLVAIDEYLHPRLQEICDTLPAGLGRRLGASSMPRRIVERLTRRGRTVRTSGVAGFVLLHTLASLRRWRRGSLRFANENVCIEAWLARIMAASRTQPELALEIARCQQLVKGYGDTHERGLRHFELLMQALTREPSLGAARLGELRKAALADEDGDALRAALAS